MTLETRLLIMRWTCLGMAASSFALGGWMVAQPNAFWELMGASQLADEGMSLAPQVLYGGAILGEGVALLLIFIWPTRYCGFLHYMMAYKFFSCAALAYCLSGSAAVPIGGWLVLVAWAAAGLIAAAIYPWGRWQEIVGHHLDAQTDA